MQGLFKHQVDFLSKNPNKTALVWSCGTSKTRTALEWTKLYKGTALAVVPKSLVTNWKREMDKWGIQIDVLSKETFRKLHKELKRYDQVIVDEVHAGFLTPQFKSQMSKSLRWYIKEHNVSRLLLASATVYTSSPWNIFSLATLLGYNLNYYKFSMEYFNYIRMGPRMIPVVKKGVEEKLAKITQKIASVVNIYDLLDVPLQQHCEPEYFSLTKGQKKAIKDNYDPIAIVRYTQQHEIENGVLLADDYREAQTFECDKNERILALVEENTKVAIIARYNAQIDMLAELLRDYKPYIIRGDVKDRDTVCNDAEKAERAVVIIQADCAEGYQLPSFGLCVFASMSFSFAKKQQLEGRFLRMDKPSRTTFIYLLTEGDSIDQGVYDAVQRKEDFQIALFNK